MSEGFRKEATVEAQQNDRNSILAFYKELIAMRKKYPVIAKGEIAFWETETDRVLAYRRTLEEQQVLVVCNLDGKRRNIKAAWSGYRILLENYEGREINPEDGIYTMEPYELMVLGK